MLPLCSHGLSNDFVDFIGKCNIKPDYRTNLPSFRLILNYTNLPEERDSESLTYKLKL